MTWWHWAIGGGALGLALALAAMIRAVFARSVVPLGVPTDSEAKAKTEALEKVEREAEASAQSEIDAIRKLTAGELVERMKELRQKGRL